MADHVCSRCGNEDHCGYGSWVDRHPVMTTVGALFSLVFIGMMFSVHPVASAAMIAVAGVVTGARAVGRRGARRAALAARADWEHAHLVERMEPIRFQAPPMPRPTDRHVMNQWPTTPIRTGPRR